jgi:hypothetical protein
LDEKPSEAERLAETTATLVRLAALMGEFDPLKLMPADIPAAEKPKLLAWLALSCEEVVRQNAPPMWRLSDAARRRALQEFSTRRGAAALAESAKQLSDDSFGAALRAALLGEEESPASASRERLDELLQARAAARVAPFAARCKASDPRPVQREIANREENTRLDVVLPGDLIGREWELQVIKSFIKGKPLPQTYQIGAAEPGARALLLTGVGGIGKSALIASLLRDDLRQGGRRRMAPVVNIDFDRPNLFGADKIEILRELSRQLGRRLRSSERALSDMRQALSELHAAGTDQSSNFQTQLVALNALRSALARGKGLARPVVVILDTFEEIAVRDQHVVLDILDWFDAIKTEGGLGGMRLIVSGRAPPDLSPEEMEKRFAGHLPLAGLDEVAGAELLRRGKETGAHFQGERGPRASRAFRGHPLALRFLSRYAQTNSTAEIDALIGEGLASHMSSDFAQAFLYTRVLGRVRDPEIAKLAHPGLVLRRVTPDLIRDVLAAPCGLGDIDDAAAKRLFDKLASTVWLVTREGPLVVRHRRDLRRLMLPAMMNPPSDNKTALELRDKAYATHRAAADWYGKRADTTSSPQQQEIEAFYHAICAAPNADIDIKKAERFGPSLGEDISDLPPRARGLAKIAMGRLSSVTDEEYALLPPDRQELVRSLKERAALQRGDTKKVARIIGVSGTASAGTAIATAIADVKGSATPTSFAQAEREFGREIDAYWAEADFDAVSATGARAFAGLWDKSSGPVDFSKTKDDPVYTAMWKYLMSLLFTDNWPESLQRSDLPPLTEWRDKSERSLCVAAHLLFLRSAPRRDLARDATLRLSLVANAVTRRAIVSSFGLRTLQLAGALLRQQVGSVLPQPSMRVGILRPFAPPLVYLSFKEPVSSSDRDAAARTNHWAFASRKSAQRISFPGAITLLAIERTLDAWSRELPYLPKPDYTRSDSYGIFHATTATEDVPDIDFFFGNVQGIFPEFHTPVTRALFNLDDEKIMRISALLAKRAAIWPAHLGELYLTASHAGRERLLAQLVLHADRCGLLAQLVDEARTLSPDRAPLDRLNALITRVEDIFHNDFSRIATNSTSQGS